MLHFYFNRSSNQNDAIIEEAATILPPSIFAYILDIENVSIVSFDNLSDCVEELVENAQFTSHSQRTTRSMSVSIATSSKQPMSNKRRKSETKVINSNRERFMAELQSYFYKSLHAGGQVLVRGTCLFISGGLKENFDFLFWCCFVLYLTRGCNE
jgi:hypothetical protein